LPGPGEFSELAPPLGRGDRGRRRGTGEGGRKSRVKKDCGNGKEKGNGMGISPHGHF